MEMSIYKTMEAPPVLSKSTPETSSYRTQKHSKRLISPCMILKLLILSQMYNVEGFLALVVHHHHYHHHRCHLHNNYRNSGRIKEQSELHDHPSISKGRNNKYHTKSKHEQQYPLILGLPVLAATNRRGRSKADHEEELNKLNSDDCDEPSLSPSTLESQTSTQTNEHLNLTIPEITFFRKLKQKRRKLKQPRRPSAFWADINNIESELRIFWSTLNVPIKPNEPPPIPNEALLNHFERHDLRYAIANMGGRDVVSNQLDGAKLIPGKWKKAVTTCKEVQYLLHPSNPAGRGLSEEVPPIAPYIKRSLQKQRLDMMKKQMKIKSEKKKREQQSIDKNICVDESMLGHDGANNYAADETDNDEEYYDDEYSNYDIDTPIERLRFMGGQRWAHSSDRNPRGHWSQDKIIQELYQYLSHVKEEKGRPSVWMPRPSELATEGRNDLRQAMVRFGGSDKTCQLAQLVPYRDWRNFESTLELFVELLKYLVKYHGGSEKVFPKLADIQGNGHERLYDLIMEYGGRKIIATKLNMEFQAQTKLDLFKGMNFGPFSVDFAVRLMYFIRNDMMVKEPPLEKPYLQMPTRQYLIEKGEERLVMEISKYGGHESIARRLNLVFDGNEAKREADNNHDKK